MEKFEIKAMPSFYIFENKELVDSFVGADKNRLSEIVKELAKKYPFIEEKIMKRNLN